ncbi:uncharacterized protein METZ01_LOCUS209255, partial [marine metagenome]
MYQMVHGETLPIPVLRVDGGAGCPLRLLTVTALESCGS